MRLFLAEKKSLGEAVASALGNAVPSQGKITCGDDVVTWCAGHILEMYMPEDYDSDLSNWELAALPIIPSSWKNKPKQTAGKQLGIIKYLLQAATSVVNCGDPDREGQLLVDEVLEHFDYTGPVERIWLDDGLTPAAIQRALGKLCRNALKAPLRDAALGRSRADWLVGLNATRAMTLIAQAAGHRGALPVGRVQTPTLRIVVDRDLLIENFKPHPFFVLRAQIAHTNGLFWATFKPSDTQSGLDADGRLVDAGQAQAICGAAKSAPGLISAASRTPKKRQPPLAYSLSALSKAASSKYGMTAKQALDAAQELYLGKLTSYPRTNCRFLPEDQHMEGAEILSALAKLSGALADVAQAASSADAALKSPSWNSAKLTAHHGIIPTGTLPSPNTLSEQAQKLFELVCMNYVAQFHPPMLYEAQEIQVTLGEMLWKAAGKTIQDAGWTAIFSELPEEDEEESSGSLPVVEQGDPITCQATDVTEKKTSPPARFTDGSLLDAMENIHRHLSSATGREKEILRQTKGIGTDATRATVIDSLIKRDLLAMQGKQLVSTPLGRQLIELVPEELKDPLTTAEWEDKLEQIAEGKLDMGVFLKAVCDDLPRHINAIKSLKLDRMANSFPCPICQKPMHRFKGKDGRFCWGCFDKESHPDGKEYFCDDKAGKPAPRAEFPCPQCKTPLKRFKGKDGKIRWGCFEEKAHPTQKALFFEDKNGKPVLRKDYPCPECQAPMRRYPSKKELGAFYWACFNDKHAKPVFVSDKNGKPDLGGKK